MGRGRGVKRRAVRRTIAGAGRKTIIIGDIHGRLELMTELLQAARAIDKEGRRVPGLTVYGLGDIVHGTIKSEAGDLACLDAAEHWLDASVIGNHEAALIGLTEFVGVWRNGPVASRVRSLVFKGFFVPALLEGHSLIVHGGVPPGLAHEDATSTYAAIMSAWDENPQGPLFNAVSSPRRGGDPSKEGGIFWLDWEESRAGHLSQIVGHSPLEEPELQSKGPVFHLNLDISNRYGKYGAAALLIDGEPAEIISLDRS